MKTGRMLLSAGLIFILLISGRMCSCTHDALLDNIPEICFDRDVLPVFLNSCAIKGCHDGTGESGFLNSYTTIINGVVPGKPYSSPIYTSLISTWGENKMPPDRPISVENRIKIRLWIEQGATQTTCPQSLNH